MGYDAGSNDVAWVNRELNRIKEWLAELSQPSSGQIYQQLAEIQSLVNELATRVNALASSGVQWQGPVNTTGSVNASNVSTSGRVTSAEALRSPGSRSFNMTSSWAGAWINFDGTIGISTSSERFKENIEPLDKEELSEALYRAVPVSYSRIGSEVTELGFIAERFVEIGLGAFVFYDADGQVEGIHYDRISIALVAALHTQREQMLSLEQRLAALEGVTA